MNYRQFKLLVFIDLSGKYGAPMGRENTLSRLSAHVTIHDRAVPMCGAYDRGGAYWGLGEELRCRFSSDGQYREYYRRAKLAVPLLFSHPLDEKLNTYKTNCYKQQQARL
tara:strand:+ start:1119 stop:1448 length:330 start_codon:yes stop_codon:yes gene_type:complete